MVGIGTSDVNLDKYRHMFCSLLGKDVDSWGLSYTGELNTNPCDAGVTSRVSLFYKFNIPVGLSTVRLVAP